MVALSASHADMQEAHNNATDMHDNDKVASGMYIWA